MGARDPNLISQKVFIKSFQNIQWLHKSVHLFFTITNITKRLTDFCGNGLLQIDSKNTLCEIQSRAATRQRRKQIHECHLKLSPDFGRACFLPCHSLDMGCEG